MAPSTRIELASSGRQPGALPLSYVGFIFWHLQGESNPHPRCEKPRFSPLNHGDVNWCPERDSNPHAMKAAGFKPTASNLFATRAGVFILVPKAGLEPALLSETDFESAASAEFHHSGMSW